MKPLAILCIVLLLGSSIASRAEAPLTVTRLADTVIDPGAWNFPDGKWGTTVNGQTYQQEALVSHFGYQYATWFADGGKLAVGRRKLPGGDWEVIRFADYTARDRRDAHNVATIGICAADGTIHLMFDHHNDPLHSRRSVKGLATRPAEFAWKAEHFGAVTDKLDGRNAIKGVSYPQQFATPDGKLQVIYRLGSSGNGDWHLAEYDGAGDGAWTAVGMPLSRAGTYQTSPNRCAYPNPLRYDWAGRLHLTWCWRESPKGQAFDLRTNHDLMYAWSDDRGRTWLDNAGRAIASTEGKDGSPRTIGIGTPGIVVAETKWLWGQMNTTTQFVDAKRRVHVINYQLPPEAKAGTTDLNLWRYFHYWRDADGMWHENRLPFSGRKPQVVIDKAGNAIVVYGRCADANYHGGDPGGRLTIAIAAEAGGWTGWTQVWAAERESVGEPLIDHARWAGEGVLSVYTQDRPAKAGGPSALRVIDFQLGRR